MRNIILIACIVLIVLLCGCCSSLRGSPTATPTVAASPTAAASASQGPIATPVPAAAAPTISPSDPASYNVNVNFGSNPYLFIDVLEDASRLTTLEVRYTPEGPGAVETSKVVEGKYLTHGVRISLGRLTDSANVTVIATYSDGASRTLFVLHQIPKAPDYIWVKY